MSHPSKMREITSSIFYVILACKKKLVTHWQRLNALMFKNMATARALKEMQASLTILWLRKRLGLCCVELHYGTVWGTWFFDQPVPAQLRNNQ